MDKEIQKTVSETKEILDNYVLVTPNGDKEKLMTEVLIKVLSLFLKTNTFFRVFHLC